VFGLICICTGKEINSLKAYIGYGTFLSAMTVLFAIPAIYVTTLKRVKFFGYVIFFFVSVLFIVTCATLFYSIVVP